MNERIAVFGLACMSLLSLWLAPWAALTRQTGARSTILLLPDRIIDFTGRSEPLAFSGLTLVLIISIVFLLTIAIAVFLAKRWRHLIWLSAGFLLVATVAWSLSHIQSVIRQERVVLITSTIEKALENPRDSVDVVALRQVLDEVPEAKIDTSILKSRKAGFTIKRLAYGGSGIGLAAFLALSTGLLSLFFGLRIFPRFNTLIDKILLIIAVPLTSILLALLIAGVVILGLQETPTTRNFVFEGWQMVLAGRLEVLWNAYLTLFANSLGTVGGFAESLKFATPLIFTGLAVAFGFQAGLFNIGAPGQMVLGAVFAMLVGLYMPGPSIVVLPIAVLAAAVGGGIWGGIPGWLKARFGANEVINTILMNYIASSVLLFMLSSRLTFAASALWIIAWLTLLSVLAIVLSLIPRIRQFSSAAPRLAFALLGIVALIGVVVSGSIGLNDPPVSFIMPFKAPGSEPKSYPLQETARLTQLPEMLGIRSAREELISLNYGLIISSIVLLVAFLLLQRLRLGGFWWQRGLMALGLAGFSYLISGVFGLWAVETIIPPTKLNASFIIALLAALFMQYFLWRTKWGYELRAVGLAPEAAEYGGASIAKNMILAMVISGAFAGLTACHYVLGGALEEFSLRQALPVADGFDGIAVALLGANTPIGIILSAFLFGVLKNGGTLLNISFSGLTRDVVSMILALVVLFIAAKGFLPERITHPLRKAERLGVAGDNSEEVGGQ